MRPTDRAAVIFINQADETAPAGCVLEPDGTVTASGQLGVTRPTAKSEGSLAVLFNGLVPVPAGGVGQGWSPYPLATVALDPADVPLDDTPTVLGVVAGDWHLRKSGSGFLAVAPDAGGLVSVIPTFIASTTTPTTTTTPPPCTGTCVWQWHADVQLWKKVSSSCSSNCLCTAPAICSGIEDGCQLEMPCVTSSQWYKSGKCVDWDDDPDPPQCWTCGGSPPGNTADDGVTGPVKAKCVQATVPQWPCDVLPSLGDPYGPQLWGQGVCVCVSADGTRSLINNSGGEPCAELCERLVPQFNSGGVSGAALSFDCNCHSSEGDCLGSCCTEAVCQGQCVYDPETGEVVENKCTGCTNCVCAPPPTTLTTPPPGECFILMAGCVPGTTTTTTAPPPWYCAADPSNPSNCSVGGCNCSDYFATVGGRSRQVKGCFQTPNIPSGWVKCSGPYGEQSLCNSNCIVTTTTCPPKWFCITNDRDSTCRDGSHCAQLPTKLPDCSQADVVDPVFGICSGPYDIQGDCEADCANVTTTPSPDYYCYSCQNYDGWNNAVGDPYSTCTNSAPGNGSGGGIHPICTQEGGPYADGTCDNSCFGTTTQTTPPPTTPPPTTPPPNTTIAPPGGSYICTPSGACANCCSMCSCVDYGLGVWATLAECQAGCGNTSTTAPPTTSPPLPPPPPPPPPGTTSPP